MKKRMMLVATAVIAAIMAFAMATSGCAPAAKSADEAGSGTSFFPNVSI